MHGNEDDANAQVRHREGLNHLGGTLDNREGDWLSQKLVAVNILLHDSHVIDKHTNGQSHAARGHQIVCLSGEIPSGDAGENREWDRSGDHQSIAPATQENQNHQGYQHRRHYRPPCPRGK